MKISNINTCYNNVTPTIQRNEIVVVNRKPNFTSKADAKLSKNIIDMLDINMGCAVNNPIKVPFQPAPVTLGEKLANFMNRLEIDWKTHFDPKAPKRRFE